jgi:tripartite-type tricarboxylate transporter receptor subunit TctC
MKPPRRHFLQLAAGAAGAATILRVAAAQSYPSRPVRIIVGAAAGGPQDIIARLMGQRLSERFGHPFVIENRPAAGNIAADVVAKAPPDGYTLLIVATPNTINATLFDKLNFNLIRDIAPVASIMDVPLVLEVNPSLPVKSVPEFIAYAKANPGKLNMGVGANGTPAHLSVELFKARTGVNISHVPYRGSAPMLTDLLGGHLEGAFDPIPGSIEHIRSSRLRALAVTSAERSDALPDIPTIGDFVPGFEASVWYGIGAPKNTRAEIIEALNKEINAAIADGKMKQRLADLGATVRSGSRADFGKLIADETEKWGKVIRAANIKPD